MCTDIWKIREKETRMLDFQRCGYRILFGGVEMPDPCSEGFIQGSDVGELQEPGVCGKLRKIFMTLSFNGKKMKEITMKHPGQK
ncbi:uncharacterized protein LOC116547017 isoform X3 [Sapajus apella]|uniref:Uncharacterized protein LOC116547017 isoform X3 n=1 Tax=Sapajus apella TaxID=9515 RepID=A0A6J3HG26_SAPAP|nr:uncharacterized protein LOC116547017 isoform X3 [Sapajus apella]